MTVRPDQKAANHAEVPDEVAASLHDRQDELRSVIENTPMVLWTINGERELEQAIGGLPQPLAGPESSAGLAQSDAATEAAERAFAGETTTRDVPHRGRTYSVTCTPVRDDVGGVRRVIGVAWDVTEQRRAEAEQRYRQFIETSPDAITQLDLDGRFLYASPSYLRMTGFSWDDLEGTFIADYVDDETRPDLLSSLAYFRVSEEPVRARGRARRRDGTYYWYESVASSWRDPETGQISTIHSIARDITAQVRVEDALQASEERYRLLAEESNDLIATFDASGTYTYASPSADRILAYRPEDLLGRNAFELVHPDDRETAIALVREGRRTGASEVTASGRVLRGDCQVAWIESSIRLIRDPITGDISHYHAIARDVTDRVRAEEARQESEERYRHLAENSVDAVLRVDLEGRFIDFSPSFAASTGFSAAEIRAMNVEEILHEDDRAALRERMAVYRVDDRPVRTRARIRKKDGGYYWSEGISCPVRDPATGAIREVHTIARDITEQVLAEEALRESEKRYRRLAEESRDLIAVLDRDANYVYASPSAERLLGRSPEELLGRNAFDFVDGEDRARTLAYVREATRNRQPEIKATYRVARPDGGTAWVESSIHPLRDETTGRVIRFHLVARDVTERVRAEESLRESEELFRLLAEDSATIVVRFGPDGLIRYVSPSIHRVLGYAPEDAIGKPLSAYLLPEDPPWIDPATSRFASTGRRRALDAPGDIVWLDISIRAVFQEDTPTPVEYHASARDVTARVEAEEALRASEERYRHLAEDSTDIIAQFGPGAVWQYASPAVTRLLGYTSDELLGTSVHDILDEEDSRRIRDLEMSGASAPVTIVHRASHKDGQLVWLETSIRPLKEAAGETTIGYHVTSRDVNRRIRAEASLRESEERYRLLAEHSADMVAIIRSDGRFLYVSPSSTRMTGYTPEELIGQSDGLIIHPDDYPLANGAVAEARRSGGVSTVRLRTVRKDGGIIWTETVARLVGEGEDDLRVYTVTRDVTRSVLSEQALREREELFRRIFDESPIPTVLSDAKGRFAKVNDAYCELLGYSREALLAMHDDRFVHPDEVVKAREGSKKVFSGELSRIHREKRYRTTDGRELVGMLTAAPIHDESGNVVYLLSIIEDITEQKRAAEELSRVAEMKSDFVTLVSHELRAPLTNIRGGLELIVHDTRHLPESAHRTLSILSNETSRLNRFVETILDVSRLEAGQLPIVLGPVAVNVVIDRATRGAAVSPAHVAPQVLCAPDLPLAWADELQLEHVLRNLIRNAGYHSPPGERIFIEAAVAQDRITITVTDRGDGIDEDDLPHVFEAFRRTRDSELKYKGYGLGLYFAKRLIEAQGGDIEAVSPVTADPVRRGARFTVRLPLAPEGA